VYNNYAQSSIELSWWVCRFAICTGLLFIFAVVQNANAQTAVTNCVLSRDVPPRVMILGSYGAQYRRANELAQTQREALLQTLSPEQIFEHSLDARNALDDARYVELQRQFLFYKLSRSNPPNVILANDDYAIALAIAERNGLFRGLPIVHAGGNIPRDFPPCMVGVIEGESIAATVVLIRQIQPTLKRLLVVSDQIDVGRAALEKKHPCQTLRSKKHSLLPEFN
jgi:hypothetical protein